MTDIPDKIVQLDQPIITGYPLEDVHDVGNLLISLGGLANPSTNSATRLLWNLGSWLSELED